MKTNSQRQSRRNALRAKVLTTVCSVAVVGAVCASCAEKPKTTTASAGAIATVANLSGSEAVSFDAARDAYFVSNVNGDPGVKDNNGFITRITGDGVVDSLHFIQGGRNGVVLHSPMGSRIQGDTLWVLDVDTLRGFSAVTGSPVAAIDLAAMHPLFVNDISLGPQGDFYITDTGVGAKGHTGPDRIYHVDRNRRVSVALESASLSMPDGIAWDGSQNRVVLAPFGGQAVQVWRPGTAAPVNAASGPSKFDGVEIEPDGTIIITIWNDSSVSTLSGDSLHRRLKLTVPPADASMDVKRKRIGVVSMANDRFELWAWPETGG